MLQQIGSMRDFTKQFTVLLVEINDMGESDKL